MGNPNDLEPQYTRPYTVDKVQSPPYRATHFKQCPMCSNRNCAPIKHGDGTVKYHFCPSCKHLSESHKFISLTDNKPLGHDNNLGKQTSFTIINSRRVQGNNKSRHIHNRSRYSQKEEIPKLAGKDDIELKYLATQGVIIALNDDNDIPEDSE